VTVPCVSIETLPRTQLMHQAHQSQSFPFTFCARVCDHLRTRIQRSPAAPIEIRYETDHHEIRTVTCPFHGAFLYTGVYRRRAELRTSARAALAALAIAVKLPCYLFAPARLALQACRFCPCATHRCFHLALSASPHSLRTICETILSD
jgi:hypothetical protein